MIDNRLESPSFSAAPPLQDFFKPASWILKFDFINHLVLFNNVMMAVIDEEGAGKTSFCKLLQDHLNGQIHTSYFSNLTLGLTQHELLVQMSKVTGQPLDDAATLEHLVESINQLGLHHLFIIDNAERLPQDFIMSLIRAMKSQKGTPFFHVCLAGDQGLARMLSVLERHDEFKNFVHAFEPGTLKLNEVKTYVRRRLMSGSVGMKHIVADDARIEAFYKLTSGHMSMINKNLDFFKSKKKPPYKVLMVASVAFVVLGSAYLLGQYQGNVLDVMDHMLTNQLTESLEREPSNIKMATLPADNVYASHMTSPSEHAVPASFEPQEQIRGSALNTDPEQHAASFASRTQAKELLAVVAVTKGRQIAVQTGIFGIEKQAVRVAEMAALPQSTERKVSAHVKHKPLLSREKHQVIRHGIATGRIIQQAPRHDGYTIQLVASKKRDDIERFMMMHHLQDDVAMKLSHRNGERWYVLTYGRYHSARQAALAMKSLPKSTTSASPWVRKERDLSAVG